MSDETSIHPTAVCDTDAIGAGSRVGAFATVAATARIGERCAVGEHATLADRVEIGDGVAVGPGARLAQGAVVGQETTIGANAVVAGVKIGRGAVIDPGAMVSDGVPANAIVRGNPAVITGYVTDVDEPIGAEGGRDLPDGADMVTPTLVPGVEVHRLTRAADLRGSLTAAEFTDLPFVPHRVFAVTDVPSETVRGSHAHKVCEQFLICLQGSFNCLVDDGTMRDEVRLDGPDYGLHMPPMVWGTQYKYTRDAVLLVLASHPYDAADYIRSYEEFIELSGRR